MPDAKPPTAEERIQRALEPNVPSFYINGFVNTLGSADVLMVGERAGQPVVTLNLSFTAAKTLAVSLSTIIAQLETASGRTMLTTHEIEAALGISPPEGKH